MIRRLPLLVALLLVAPTLGQTLEQGPFKLTLDPANVLLPSSLTYNGTELLDAKLGLNHGFTSFEFHNKFYREENSNVWPQPAEPRFVHDATLVGNKEVSDGEWRGSAVDYTASYATVTRTIWLHATQPQLKIEYDFTFTRDTVVHEVPMFNVGLRFAPGFTEQRVADARTAGAVLTLTGAKQIGHTADLFHGGPRLAINPERNLGVVVSDRHAGDVATPAPARLLRFKPGQHLTLAFDLRLGEPAALAAELTRHPAPTTTNDLADRWLMTARALRELNQIPAAEQAFLAAADAAPELAQPWGDLAGLRRDFKLPGQTEAWVEGGYRMPYNYGYLLSGSGLWRTPGLTVEQQRLHLFNLLLAAENDLFYSEYYAWAARDAEAFKMPTLALALYRQALWATDYTPRSEENKAKLRERFTKKIAELEEKLKSTSRTDLPWPTPVRAPQP